jgi:hypothetical protein
MTDRQIPYAHEACDGFAECGMALSVDVHTPDLTMALESLVSDGATVQETSSIMATASGWKVAAEALCAYGHAHGGASNAIIDALAQLASPASLKHDPGPFLLILDSLRVHSVSIALRHQE